jgi:hypothetical protein
MLLKNGLTKNGRMIDHPAVILTLKYWYAFNYFAGT